MTIVIESDKVARALYQCSKAELQASAQHGEHSVSAAQRGLAPLWRKEIK